MKLFSSKQVNGLEIKIFEWRSIKLGILKRINFHMPPRVKCGTVRAPALTNLKENPHRSFFRKIGI